MNTVQVFKNLLVERSQFIVQPNDPVGLTLACPADLSPGSVSGGEAQRQPDSLAAVGGHLGLLRIAGGDTLHRGQLIQMESTIDGFIIVRTEVDARRVRRCRGQ